jgi:Domain of unknown function (DUF4383)
MSVFEPAWAAAPMSKFSSPVQRVALAVGAVFLAVGVLGLVSGITTHHGRLTFAGRHFGAALRGIVNVSVVHGLLHLGPAVAMIARGVAVGRTRDDTGQPVGTGGPAQRSTPIGPAL